MRLDSNAFAHEGTIPQHYTCDSSNVSPPLRWDDPPAETQSLALIVDDPDAPSGTFVHWVLFDLPPKTRALPEAVAISDRNWEGGGIQGTNSFGNLDYGGPCPPDGTHRYFFKLYALRNVLGLAEGATKQDVEAAMEGQVLASAELMGLYERNKGDQKS
jgi:hypothetical protein